MIDKNKIRKFTKDIGLSTCLEFAPKLLVPDEKVRGYCLENKCGSCGKNYMCPPHVGTLEDIASRLEKYSHGYLLQYSKVLDVSLKNLKEVVKTKKEFHKKVVQVEQYLHEQGIDDTWGLIGGNCGLCKTCGVITGEECRHPEEARASLEAIGIDVMSLLKKLGLQGEFRRDGITWTGCVLYNPVDR